MPISNLPSSNNAAVIAAPSQTSRHSTSVSGSNLNIIANIAVMATKEMSEPATCRTVCGNAALSGCRQSGGEQERDQQQKTDPNHRGQRNEIGPDELPEPADLFFVDLPHGI